MKKSIYSAFVCVLFLASCSTTKLTRESAYPKMYEEKPVTVLIMPPINRTVNVEAKEYFYTSLSVPLAEKGYYVISPFLAMELFRTESAYDSEMFINGNLTPFKNVFNADVALFTIIDKWEKSTLGNTISVELEYILKSTSTGEVFFTRKGALTVDTSINGGSSGIGMLVGMVASAINTALTDKVIAARRCNNFVLSDMPEGKYSPNYGKDKAFTAGGPTFSGTVKQ